MGIILRVKLNFQNSSGEGKEKEEEKNTDEGQKDK